MTLPTWHWAIPIATFYACCSGIDTAGRGGGGAVRGVFRVCVLRYAFEKRICFLGTYAHVGTDMSCSYLRWPNAKIGVRFPIHILPRDS